MKIPLRLNVVLSGLLAVAACARAQAGLIHRFSFTDGKDSAGNVTGQPKGDGASFAGGQLVLKNDLAAPAEKVSFLEFSAPLLPKGGTTTSIAVWFTAKDVGGFARVLNFGASDGGEGRQFIYFSPATAEGMARMAITGSDVGSKTFIDTDPLDDGKPHMVVIVVDGAAKKLRVYVDGKEPKAAEDLGDNTLDKVKPVENWIGKSSFVSDPGLTAAIDELRVYDHALTADEVAAALKAGPNALPPATAAPGTPAAPTPTAPAATTPSTPAPAIPASPPPATPRRGAAQPPLPMPPATPIAPPAASRGTAQ